MTQKRYSIEITEQIINTATQRDSGHCVIADAVRQQIPNAIRVAVDLQTIKWTDPKAGRRYVAFTPPVGQQALVDFDQGKPVKPFRIRLNVIQTIRSGPQPDGKRTSARKITTTRSDVKQGKQPTSEGGRVPPAAALSNRAGRRRSFGLRSLRP